MVFVHSKTSFGIAVIFLAATLSSLVNATDESGDCAPRCQAQIKAANEKFGVKDVMDVSELKETVKKSRDAMTEKLRTEYYGEYTDKLFFMDGNKESSRGFEAFQPTNEFFTPGEPGPSPKRFQRKLMLKVLDMQANLLENGVKGCDCSGGGSDNSDGRRRLRHTEAGSRNLDETNNHLYSKFVWTTAGHSSAAGHGNLCNQSYTAYMGRAASPVFASIGIELEARNGAMGSMNSAPQLAVCSNAYYGIDSDVITWDFGMTDGGQVWSMGMHAHRAGMNPNRPVLVSINTHSGPHERQWLGINNDVENHGVGTFFLNSTHIKQMHEIIPDMMGMPVADVEKLPPYLQHYKCEDKIEFGDPDCRQYKYTIDEGCTERKAQVSWHPGYKSHSLYGTLMAYFLVDNLLKAMEWLEEEVKEKPMPARERYEQLLEAEKVDYANFRRAAVTDRASELFSLTHPTNLIDPMYRHEVYCHTAVTPSQERYLGLSVEGVNETTPYPFGIDLASAGHKTENNNGTMWLAYNEEEIEPQCALCYRRDHKDQFYINSHMGPTTLTVPTKAALDYYGPFMTSPKFKKAIIMLCTTGCGWRKCKKEEMYFETYGTGFQLKINGVDVKKMEHTSASCSILVGENDQYEWEPNADQQFDIEATIQPTEEGEPTYLKISQVAIMNAEAPQFGDD